MFQFYEPPFGNPESHRFHLVATLAKNIRSTRRLIGSVGVILGFPPHFGRNFDAFWDCIRSLASQPKDVALIHQDIPEVDAEDLEVYLELLRDAALYWQKHAGEHHLEVWFPIACREKIDAIMKNIPLPEDDELE